MRLHDTREHKRFMELAVEEALKATCERSRCGSVIVADGEVIGKGYNSPPGELESQRRCSNTKTMYHQKVTDKTCCVHAEQRAIMDALQKNPEKIRGSRLYFIRLDDDGKMSFAGKPYCTICSKMALDVGIKEFVLYHEDGITAYETDEYNDLSYSYEG
ncbi:MAG: deaminase [Candidatus Woesearchaeota archaeon]